MFTDSMECSVFEPNDEIRQGTIIKFNTKNENEKLGIIVTADCDIAQNKHGKYLSYCNIITLDSYIKDYFIPKKCHKKRNEKYKKIKTQTQNFLNKILSDTAFIQLLEYDKEELEKIINNKSLIDEILGFQPFYKLDNYTVEEFLIFCKMNQKEFENELKCFPGDKFFIGIIPDPEYDTKGFVIDLRRIKEINKDDIYIRYYGDTPDCFALANLNSPFKEKMAQTLGTMFSDLGFSIDYEIERNSIISTIAGEFIK